MLEQGILLYKELNPERLERPTDHDEKPMLQEWVERVPQMVLLFQLSLRLCLQRLQMLVHKKSR